MEEEEKKKNLREPYPARVLVNERKTGHLLPLSLLTDFTRQKQNPHKNEEQALNTVTNALENTLSPKKTKQTSKQKPDRMEVNYEKRKKEKNQFPSLMYRPQSSGTDHVTGNTNSVLFLLHHRQ